MKRFVLAALLGALLATGCQSVGIVPTESMQVKKMMIDGTELAYVEEGSGPTVLFVHGASGDWRTWDGLRPYLSPKYRFVSVSRRYHYPNNWSDDGGKYTFDQQVEDTAAFIRGMNVGKVHLVGNSYSGRLAGVLALKYPQLLRSVVLGEPNLVPPTSPEGKTAAAAFVNDMGKASAAAKAGDDRQSAIFVANAVMDDPDGFSKLSPIRQQRWLDNAKTMGPMFGRAPAPVTCDQLRGLTVPVLAIRGENTRSSYRHGHEMLLTCLPKSANEIIVAGGTHFWPADKPADAATALLAFIGKY